jgi:hypothetical protein
MSELQGLVWPERLGKLKNFIQLIQSQTCDFLASSIVIMLGVAMHKNKIRLVMLLASFPSQIQKLLNLFLSCFAHFIVFQKSRWDWTEIWMSVLSHLDFYYLY